MKKLSVFTPTYNRSYCLGDCYNSLCNQTEKGFTWLIVDDGSTDETKMLVDSWIQESKIDIIYVYQENQGMHGAHNTAYKNIDTEFSVCIDSDDQLSENAIEIILGCLPHLTVNNAGLVGLNCDKDGSIIGTKMPEDINECTLTSLYQDHGVKGDKKLVLRTEVVRKYPAYPIFKDERFVPLGTLYALIDRHYTLKVLNEVLGIVEYREDGSTKNILRQYRKNPRGFGYARRVSLSIYSSKKVLVKDAIHLVSSAIFARDLRVIKGAKHKLLIVFLLLPGIALNLYIRLKTKRR